MQHLMYCHNGIVSEFLSIWQSPVLSVLVPWKLLGLFGFCAIFSAAFSWSISGQIIWVRKVILLMINILVFNQVPTLRFLFLVIAVLSTSALFHYWLRCTDWEVLTTITSWPPVMIVTTIIGEENLLLKDTCYLCGLYPAAGCFFPLWLFS